MSNVLPIVILSLIYVIIMPSSVYLQHFQEQLKIFHGPSLGSINQLLQGYRARLEVTYCKHCFIYDLMQLGTVLQIFGAFSE